MRDTPEQVRARLASYAANPPEDIQPPVIRRRDRGDPLFNPPPCCPTCGKVL